MKRICLIHAGMPKTGSSSIQAAYSGYSDDHLDYANLGRPNHTVPLVASLAERPENFYVFRRAELPPKEIADRVARHKARFESALLGDRSVLFSAEGIVDHLRPDEIRAMLDRLRTHFDTVRVLIYVRPLASLAASQFQQRLKMGLASFNLPAPNYRKRFEPFIMHAGAENVTFARFTRDDLFHRNVVLDFAKRVGLQPPDTPAPIVNETLSSEALGSVLAFNRYIAPRLSPRDRSRMMHTLLAQLRGHAGTRFVLQPDLIRAHINANRADLDWAAQHCGFDVEGDVEVAPDAIASEADLLARALRP